MSKLLLRRLETGDQGTFGKLYDEAGGFEAVTCELPWRDNQHEISCIPVGEYQVIPRNSPKFGQHFWVLHVPNRDMILMHKGNTIKDTNGCILPGKVYGQIDGLKAVLNSGTTLERLLEKYPKGYLLAITQEY